MDIDRRLFFKSAAAGAPARFQSDGSPRRRCLVVFDIAKFEVEYIGRLGQFMVENGWEGILMSCYRPTADLQFFDLDTLKPADAAEIRELLKGIQDANRGE